jgi:hypothetical protein
MFFPKKPDRGGEIDMKIFIGTLSWVLTFAMSVEYGKAKAMGINIGPESKYRTVFALITIALHIYYGAL